MVKSTHELDLAMDLVALARDYVGAYKTKSGSRELSMTYTKLQEALLCLHQIAVEKVAATRHKEKELYA
jgi:hypothetical protein